MVKEIEKGRDQLFFLGQMETPGLLLGMRNESQVDMKTGLMDFI